MTIFLMKGFACMRIISLMDRAAKDIGIASYILDTYHNDELYFQIYLFLKIR